MVSCPCCYTDTVSGRQRPPPVSSSDRALHGEVCAYERNTAGVECALLRRSTRRRGTSEPRRSGTTSFPEVGPEVVLISSLSGDVNQGREMEVLPCELDALDAAMIAVERVGK